MNISENTMQNTGCTIKPLWAAEVEPNCIDITRYRFKDVMHVGSVTELKGDEIQPVDIITFGSPCQDLSIAGKRKGLNPFNPVCTVLTVVTIRLLDIGAERSGNQCCRSSWNEGYSS